MKKYLLLLLPALVSAATTSGCSSDDEPVQITSLKLNRTELTLSMGESFHLEATTRPSDAGVPIKWTTSNDEVATVDDEGVVTAVGYGAAVITARYRSYSARCSVSLAQRLPLDPTAALGAGMSESLIYSRDALLYAPRRIMQGFDLVSDGSIYYSQISSDADAVNICRAEGPDLPAQTDCMICKYFGHGTQIVAEEAADGKTYIWLNSNASIGSSGEYGDNLSVSRVEFVPGTVCEEGHAGETFFLNKDGQYDQQISIDFEARRLLIGSRKSGVRYFWIFDLDEAMALPLKKMTATVVIGSADSAPVTRTIDARDLNDCRVLGSFSVPAGSNTQTDVYSYSHQGHEVWGDYVYFYEGNALEVAGSTFFQPKAYLTAFDYTGRIVLPRTEVAAIADVQALIGLGLTTTGWAEPESMKLHDGKLYLGLACRDGSSSDRRANILVYDCVNAR